MHPVGSCGQRSHCAFSAPIACYTCTQFNAWVDGPHEVILEHLIAEEERLSKIVNDGSPDQPEDDSCRSPSREAVRRAQKDGGGP